MEWRFIVATGAPGRSIFISVSESPGRIVVPGPIESVETDPENGLPKRRFVCNCVKYASVS